MGRFLRTSRSFNSTRLEFVNRNFNFTKYYVHVIVDGDFVLKQV